MAKNYRKLILARLNNLSKRFPMHYAQLIVCPVSLPPAYAMDDDKSEWWSSDEAASFCESLNQNNIE